MAIIKQYLNPYQGAIEAWVRPNWNGNDNKRHTIMHIDAVDTTCVLNLHFDEGEGTVAYDSSVYGNNGTLYGGVEWTDGVVGKGLSFDEVDDYVDCGADASLDSRSAFTYMSWFNSTSTVSTSVWEGVLSRMGSNGNIALRSNYAGTYITFRVQNYDSTLHMLTYPRIIGETYFSVGTFNAGNTKFYVDGVLRVEATEDFTSASDLSGVALHVGESSNRYHKGMIDEPTIFNRALSASEIKAIYENGRTGIAIAKGEDNNIGFIYPGSGISTDISSWTAGSLHHIIVNYNNNEVTMFIDGTKYGPNTRDTSATIAKIGSDLWIGSILGKYQFDGTINLRTYSVPIPETQADALAMGLPAYQNVQSLYSNGSGLVNFVNDTVMFQTAGYEFV